jgi:hypothetical protein
MNLRRITGLFGGAAASTLAVGAAQAQDDLGNSIATTVGNAVSSISTSSGGSVSGGASVETNSIELGEQEGLAIADASGGDHNISFVS